LGAPGRLNTDTIADRPGLREHLLFSPTAYVTNKFMDSFRHCVEFLWHESPCEAYVQDQRLGLFSFSNLFLERTSRLGCWRMSRDFLCQYPELRAVIPCSSPSMLGERLPSLLESATQDNVDVVEVADLLLC